MSLFHGVHPADATVGGTGAIHPTAGAVIAA